MRLVVLSSFMLMALAFFSRTCFSLSTLLLLHASVYPVQPFNHHLLFLPVYMPLVFSPLFRDQSWVGRLDLQTAQTDLSTKALTGLVGIRFYLLLLHIHFGALRVSSLHILLPTLSILHLLTFCHSHFLRNNQALRPRVHRRYDVGYAWHGMHFQHLELRDAHFRFQQSTYFLVISFCILSCYFVFHPFLGWYGPMEFLEQITGRAWSSIHSLHLNCYFFFCQVGKTHRIKTPKTIGFELRDEMEIRKGWRRKRNGHPCIVSSFRIIPNKTHVHKESTTYDIHDCHQFFSKQY